MTRSISPYMAWFAWLCAALFYMYQFVLRVAPNVLAENLMQDFGVQGCALGVLSAFYYNAYAGMQVPLGIMMDRFGPRRVLVVSTLLAAGGTILFAWAPTLTLAAVGRFFVGAGAACGFIGSLKMATIWLPRDKHSTAIGFTMVFGTLGATFGGPPLGYLASTMGWRTSLVFFACFGFVLSTLIFLTKNRRSNPDHAHEHVRLWDGLYHVLTTPQAWALALFGCLMYVPLAAIADLWGSQFLAKLYGIDHKIASSIITTVYYGVAVGSPLTVLLSERLKSRKKVMAGAALCSLILYPVIIYMPGIPMVAMGAVFFIAGLSFTGQNLVFASMSETMPLSITGVSLGFLNMVVMLSGVVFQPLVGKLLDSHSDQTLINGVPHFTLADFQYALLPIPVALIGALVVLYFIQETHPTRTNKGPVTLRRLSLRKA